MSEGEDWYSKYKSMKKNLDEIIKIRVDGPKQDSAHLQQIIAQHEQKHKEHLDEIRQQMEILDDQKQEIENKKDNCKMLEKKIKELKLNLGQKNGIIRTLIKYDIFKVLMRKPEIYSVTILVESAPTFFLIKEKGELIYSPGSGFPRDCPKWMKEKLTVELNKLDRMCRDFQNFFFGE